MMRLREIRCDDHVLIVAESGGERVGHAAVGSRAWLRPDWRHAEVRVSPGHRGSGIGTRLWERAAPRAPAGTRLYAAVRGGDSRSLGAARAWGFTPFQLSSTVVLDVRGAPDVPDRTGLTLTTWRMLDDTGRRSVDSLMRACDTSPEARAFMSSGIESLPPTWRPHVIVAEDGDRPVGICVADLVNDRRWHVRFTGVLPDARGRGIARSMKGLLHATARDQGVRWVTAANAEGNQAIRTVNRAFGYARLTFNWRLCRPSAR